MCNKTFLSLAILCVLISYGSAESLLEPHVAVIDDRPISRDEFERFVADKLLRQRNELYSAEISLLNEFIDERLLAAEAASRHLTTEEYLQREITAKSSPVSEAEARAVIENSNPKTPITPEAITAAISDIIRRRRNSLRAELLASIRLRHSTLITLKQPEARQPVSGGQSSGPQDALVSIVEFSDFQCPYCAPMSVTLDQIRQVYGPVLRLTYKHFPLPNHPQAKKAAETAVCAAEQGKFWEMHDRLFSEQRLLTAEAFAEIANRAGLDLKNFDQCMASGLPLGIVTKDFADGMALGITATPTLLINGKMYVGARSTEALRKIIDEELARQDGQR